MAGCVEKECFHESLLIKIVREDPPQRSSKPLIQKVPLTLRQVKTNETCFDPKELFLGPYHYPKTIMDIRKEEAARWFFNRWPRLDSNDKVMKIYNDFVKEATFRSPLRDWYTADDTMKKLNDEAITFIMFLDGCFILYVVYLAVRRHEGSAYLSNPFLLSDMFLLENQIPYVVLKALMRLMPDPNIVKKEDIEKFVELQFPPEHGSLSTLSSEYGTCSQIGRTMSPWLYHSSSNSDNEPLHLLDILRIKLIGCPITASSHHGATYYFRSIMELKAAGIILCKIHSNNLSKIEFKKSLLCGYLLLPQMNIDDLTKTRLLNLIAYESCPSFPFDSTRVITSYICFLNSLIDSADDVKELRSKSILLNRLGSDEAVAKLFNEVATNVMPEPKDYVLYADALLDMQSHCRGRLKVRFAEMRHTYFSSPWSAISLGAATFLLVLTVVQTIYTIW